MIVKICGITNLEDALAAVDGGAAALGFNFWPRSPRYIAPKSAAEIVRALGAAVWKAGVFVNEPRAAEIAREVGLDIVQLHGDESPAAYPASFRVWKAVRVEAGFDIAAWDGCPAEALLLDGPAGALYGGAGATFDWHLARGTKKIVLAGGLDASNVRAAIEQARPWGVDACSHLESALGRKDHRKMAAFLEAAIAASGPGAGGRGPGVSSEPRSSGSAPRATGSPTVVNNPGGRRPPDTTPAPGPRPPAPAQGAKPPSPGFDL